MARWLIGELAERAGLSASTVRYYEEIGVLPAPGRSPSGYRRYSERTLDELRFIRKAQALGFSLQEIAEILRLARAGRTSCSYVLGLARQHLAALEERIGRLRRFRDQLAGEIGRWDGDRSPTCEGLCQIIATADTEGLDATDVHPQPAGRTRRLRRMTLR